MQRDVGNMLSGSVLTAVGIFYCLYAYAEYPTGSIRQIGPGLFPVALGVILAGLGLLIFVTALFSTGRTPALSVATPLLILLAVAAFALLIRPFGLIPAVIATTIISSLAELRFRTALRGPGGVFLAGVRSRARTVGSHAPPTRLVLKEKPCSTTSSSV